MVKKLSICEIPVIGINNPEDAIQDTGGSFKIKGNKHYAPVVTLSINDNIKSLENIKQVFKGLISWSKYIAERTTQPKSNSFDYILIQRLGMLWKIKI